MLFVDGGEMTIGKYFAAGALTGSCVAFVEGPIDLMKTQMQVQVLKANPEPHFATFFGTVGYVTKNHGKQIDSTIYAFSNSIMCLSSWN